MSSIGITSELCLSVASIYSKWNLWNKFEKANFLGIKEMNCWPRDLIETSNNDLYIIGNLRYIDNALIVKYDKNFNWQYSKLLRIG